MLAQKYSKTWIGLNTWQIHWNLIGWTNIALVKYWIKSTCKYPHISKVTIQYLWRQHNSTMAPTSVLSPYVHVLSPYVWRDLHNSHNATTTVVSTSVCLDILISTSHPPHTEARQMVKSHEVFFGFAFEHFYWMRDGIFCVFVSSKTEIFMRILRGRTRMQTIPLPQLYFNSGLCHVFFFFFKFI